MFKSLQKLFIDRKGDNGLLAMITAFHQLFGGMNMMVSLQSTNCYLYTLVDQCRNINCNRILMKKASLLQAHQLGAIGLETMLPSIDSTIATIKHFHLKVGL